MPRTSAAAPFSLSKRTFLQALTGAGIGGVVFPSVWRSALSAQVAQEREPVTLIYCWRRLPTLSRDEAQKYWFETHGPLVRAVATALDLRRYVQLHSLADLTSARVRAARQSPEPFDGAAELWWNSYEDFAPTVISAERAAAGARFLEELGCRSPSFVAVITVEL